MKIKIYAPGFYQAARLAADMNLALRHWKYAGESQFFRLDTWADVGEVMDYIQELEWQLRQLDRWED